MLVITRKLVAIDDDVSAEELAKQYKAGDQHERDKIIERLGNDHPGLVALFIYTASAERILMKDDIGELVIKLIDHRVKTMKEFEP